MLMVSNISELESAAHQLYVLKIEDGVSLLIRAASFTLPYVDVDGVS